ncbi:MAG TPA: serine/threonine-protein kinase, partial [Gemmatimonadales bacterium]|nr:serine/threonine-protein kinase [Gemmatimonadales bacterium]
MSERETSDPTGTDRLEALYESARALSPDARAKFVAEACAGDDSAERELNSLLAHTTSAETFFANLSQAIVSPAVGHSIGQYQLTGILGAGGMGTVYRAHDSRLDREVALKLLPLYLSSNPEARDRFLVEARAAAALEHPNVCSIHEIGDLADGRPFIAMACYDGETLKERIARGPLTAAEAADITIQLARGLSAAHTRGIVHRDVKPGNIMLCPDGTVRLLDFGLAKVADVSITGPGATPGTVAYMSPEQTRGDPVDHLSDLWSVGVVLYEMLSGIRPFRGGNDRAVVQAILHEPSPPLPKMVQDSEPELSAIVARLLRKEPGERYPSALELIDDLAQTRSAGPVTVVRRWIGKRARVLALSGIGLAAALTIIVVGVSRKPGGAAAALPAADATTIAVLPFTVRSAGLEVWREGMVDLLSMGIDGAAGIRTVDSRTLLATWRQEMGSSSTADLTRSLAVARRTHARYALLGSVIGASSRIRLSATVYDAVNARSVGSVQVDGPADSLLPLIDRLGVQTLGLIFATDPSHVPTVNLAAITTSSLTALKAYLDGEEHYRRSEFTAAAAAWESAVQADSLFALAYLGLADAYAWYTYGPFERNLRQARRLAARLPQRERIKVQMRWARYIHDPNALATIRQVVRTYPDAADAWYELGEVYFHDAAGMLDPDLAEYAFRKSVELQPMMAPYRAHLLDLAFTRWGDSGRIVQELALYQRLAPDELRSHSGPIAFALAFGDSAARDSAGAAIGGLDSRTATDVYRLMEHPRFAEARRAALPILMTRLDRSGKARTNYRRLFNLALVDGHLHEALTVLADSTLPALLRSCGPLYYEARGLPVPLHALQRGRAVAGTGPNPLADSVISCAADYAARFGDWKENAALVARMHARISRSLADGDSAGARLWLATVRASEGYALMLRGRKAEALRAYEDGLRAEGENGQYSLWFVGRLALELGRRE